MSNTGDNKKDQLKKVFNAFFDNPKTMKEVDIYTGVMRENICRYVCALRQKNKIALVGYRKCKITGKYKVGTYTTNPDLFPRSNQLKMF
ncbi:hypothetical protein EC396_13415 [Lutibacter sp. HS1-25]|uniref:hypothetical protein n=1 Tax=Lutibacter sp. HS1-25 TaxID=2485000 RepID=UPI0010136A97|nr:hypothetical protein [Lutibacter sp. HS1-25]RXP46873.1 hypothetical protein EC396_13415 [Lutibacter sp. HS1-25]